MSTVVKSRTVDDFFANAKAIAKAVDQGEKVEPQPKVISFEPDEFKNNISPERINLLRELKCANGPISIQELSIMTNKKASWVSRVVRQMEDYGVVKAQKVSNPGHGIRKEVMLTSSKMVLQVEI